MLEISGNYVWVGGWVDECVGGWVDECVGGWVSVWVGGWVDDCGWVGECVGGWMGVWAGNLSLQPVPQITIQPAPPRILVISWPAPQSARTAKICTS